MTLNELLNMSEEHLGLEYAKARRQNNKDIIEVINTIRISRIINSTTQLFNQEQEEKIPYYEFEEISFFYPKYKPYVPGIKNHIEWLILAHMNSQGPIFVNIELLKSLVTSNHLTFERISKPLDLPLEKTNILNLNYYSEMIQEIKLPDVWVPNGEDELKIAVEDMPKNDAEAVLLTNLTSYLVIGDYITINKTFTDAFYSPNESEKSPKAIILNDIAGINATRLEEELRHQSVRYNKKQNMALDFKGINKKGKKIVNLDLSTIWTAKFKEIIEDAIKDSQEKEEFTPDVTKIYKIPSNIVTILQYNGQTLGLDVNYNTVILFDDKMIFYNDNSQDEKRTSITEIFTNYGLPSIVTEEPIDLTKFLLINQKRKENEKEKGRLN